MIFWFFFIEEKRTNKFAFAQHDSKCTAHLSFVKKKNRDEDRKKNFLRLDYLDTDVNNAKDAADSEVRRIILIGLNVYFYIHTYDKSDCH